MTTNVQPPVRDTRAAAVVTTLVDGGFVDPSRAEAAVVLVDGVLSGPASASVPLRNRFAELAGYLGGALVVSAAGIFVTAEWANLEHAQQIGLLVGSTALLGVAGAILVLTGGGRGALREARGAVRRRLAGLLFTAMAGTAAAAVGLQTSHALQSRDSTEALLASLSFLVVSALGYLVAPTVVGQLGIAVGAFLTVPWALDENGDIAPVAFGLVVLAIGVAWLAMAERGVWRESASARVIGCTLALVGAQIPLFGSGDQWVAYAATAVVAGAAFGVFVVRPGWPYLATGVIGVTLAVPEALLDWTDGSLGVAGGLLIAGGTLLGAALLGLRLRHEVQEDQAG